MTFLLFTIKSFASVSESKTGKPMTVKILATIDFPDPIPPVIPTLITGLYLFYFNHFERQWNNGLIIFSKSEEHTSELQSRPHLVCRLLLEKKKNKKLQLRSRMKIREGKLQGFKRQAAVCISNVKEKDPGTLQYD